MIRAAGYCRVSTEHEDQLNSYESQQRYFREWISAREGWVLHEIYADSGISGTSTKKRSQFNRMMEDARRGCFDLLLTKEVSRFSRNILDTIAFTRELKQLGIGVIFLTDGINTMDPDAELRLSIMASMAQEESRKTSARVIWGQTRQMENGVVFGHSLLGYDVINGKISVNPEGAAVVRRIFHAYAIEKKGAAAIAEELKREKKTTLYGSVNWTAGTVLKILKNEKYAGDLVQKKTYTPDYLTHQKKINPEKDALVTIRNHHEAIVSRELWNAAEEQRKLRYHGSSEAHSVRYPLSGKVRCGECGAVFISRQKKRPDGTVFRRWGCAKAAVASAGCSVGHMLREDSAMEMLKTVLQSLEYDRKAMAEIVLGDIADNVKMYDHETALERISGKRENALDAMLAGRITSEELNRMRSRYDREEAEIRSRMEQYDIQKDKTETVLLLEAFMNGECKSHAFWQNLVDRITVYADGHVTVKLAELETLWTFRQEI